MLKKIMYGTELLGIVVRADQRVNGVEFLTSHDKPLQLGLMGYNKGHILEPHYHLSHSREISKTSEFLYIKSGKLRCNFFDECGVDLKLSIDLFAGDSILLFSKGHGFEVLEDVQLFEVKNGPYVGDSDKKWL